VESRFPQLSSSPRRDQSKASVWQLLLLLLVFQFLYELEKLSLKLLLLLLLLLQKKTKRRLLPNCRLDPESSNTQRNSPPQKNQTTKALQLLLGFLNSACKEKLSQTAAVATSSSSSSSSSSSAAEE
jgi:hypothetical protein